MRVLILAACLSVLAFPALAVDFSTPIKGVDEVPIKDGDKDLTLGRACSTALFASYPDEKDITPEEKFSRGILALKLRGGGNYEPTAEEIVLLKKLVGKAYGPLIVVRVLPLLDPSVATSAPPAGSHTAKTDEPKKPTGD